MHSFSINQMLNISVCIKLSYIIIMLTALITKRYAAFHKHSNINENDIDFSFELMTLL